MAYECIEVRTEGGKVGVITLHRPKQLNALNNALMDELGAALKAFDADLAAFGADFDAFVCHAFLLEFSGGWTTIPKGNH